MGYSLVQIFCNSPIKEGDEVMLLVILGNNPDDDCYDQNLSYDKPYQFISLPIYGRMLNDGTQMIFKNLEVVELLYQHFIKYLSNGVFFVSHLPKEIDYVLPRNYNELFAQLRSGCLHTVSDDGECRVKFNYVIAHKAMVMPVFENADVDETNSIRTMLIEDKQKNAKSSLLNNQPRNIRNLFIKASSRFDDGGSLSKLIYIVKEFWSLKDGEDENLLNQMIDYELLKRSLESGKFIFVNQSLGEGRMTFVNK